MAGQERAGLADVRKELLSHAFGSVVEVGAGTGANLAHYPPAVCQLVLVEPEEPMARRLERRVCETSVPARVVRAPAEAIPLPDASFDVAVCTLVLCTVGDLQRGRLLFLEHVRAADPALARWQDRLHPLWVRVGHGCHCNRATLDEIAAAGFTIDEVERSQIPKAPAIVRPMIIGSASLPAALG
jgi:SAM-dependent methyltransferase